MRLPSFRKITTSLTAALLLCLPQTTYAQDYTTGLVSHWTLDETSGTNANDGAGTNTGTLQDGLNAGTNTTPGAIGTALQFDGSNDNIDAGNDPSINGITGNITVSVWVKADTLGDNKSILSNSRDCCGTYNGFELDRRSTGAYRFTLWNGTSRSISTPVIAVTDRWQHIVGTYDGAQIRIYVDGTEENSVSYSGGIGSPASFNFKIGELGYLPNVWAWDGAIDDVRIYNRALTSTDVDALYHSYTCSNPNSVTGALYFNDDEKVLQYCNGSSWTGIGPKSTLSSGLVGHWTLDETSGASIADSAGSNTGTWTDGVNNDVAEETTTGQNGAALTFDGTDDEIIIPHFALSGTSGLTIASWVYLDNAVTDPRIISKNDTAFNSGHDWALFMDDSGGNERLTTRLRTSGNSAAHRFISSYNLPLDEWHHVAVTYNETTALISMYVDGVFHSSQTHPDGGPIDAGNTGRNIAIGNSGAGGRFWDGMLDDIRVYERPLSASEISKLYNQVASCSAPTSGLVGHWPLDETSGASITDTTGTNTGTWTDGVNNDVTEETTAGQMGTALVFDGVNDFIDAGTNSSLDTSDNTHSVAFWMKKNTPSSTGDIVSKGIGSVGGYTSGVGIHPCGTNSFKATKFGVVDICFGSVPSDTNWHHIVTVWNTDGVRVYVDGTQNAFDSNTSNFTSSGNPLTIGTGVNGNFDGTIDDVRVYDRALSVAEVTELYGAVGGICNTSTCTSPIGANGEIVFNSDHDVMQYCNGNEWIAMGPQGDGGGGCTNPTGLAGELRYNADLNVVQYCEGDEWISAISQNNLSIPTAGLIGHWTLDETSGATISDSAGSNTGTWVDGVNNDVAEETQTGTVGNALTFDHVDDFINVGSVYNTASPVTVSAWIRPGTVLFSNAYTILSNRTSGNSGFTVSVDSAVGSSPNITAKLNFTIQSVASYRTTTNPIMENQWSHIAVTYDGTDIRYYIDGTHLETLSAGSMTVGTDMLIGASGPQSSAGSVFLGLLDDVRVYNRSLSNGEVQSLYLGTR
ncbi:MAG: LamG domain-containing protein [Alphaproteobacteria bacterium]